MNTIITKTLDSLRSLLGKSGIDPKSCGNVIGKLPSMALDTGILAGMTALTKIFCPCLSG